MIDVKDLMCGNWLYNNVLGHAYKLGNIPHWLREEEHDPIPVTGEMLKRIGFEEDTTADIKNKILHCGYPKSNDDEQKELLRYKMSQLQEQINSLQKELEDYKFALDSLY